MSHVAVDPGKHFECHLLDENCKCNLQEHLLGKGSLKFDKYANELTFQPFFVSKK